MDDPQNAILFEAPRAAVTEEEPSATGEQVNGQADGNGLLVDQGRHTESFPGESQ